MAPGFTLKSLSPSRPSLPLSIPSFPGSTNPSPLSSPGRSPINPHSPSTPGYFPPTQSNKPTAVVSREEAFKVVKHVEEVLSAWNEYRVALSHAGKAGKKLAAALKDLGGCMDKTSVSAQTIKPSAAVVESTAELLGKLGKKVDGAYDQANSDASKYFNLLAKESRSHDAYLQAVSKKHDKADKAYRKASKSLGDNSSAHSGLVALKTTLADDIARANADQDALLGSKQTGMMLRMSSIIGGLAGNITSFFSDGLRKTGSNYSDVEYFRVLADLQWQSALPPKLDEVEDEKNREEIRLIKTRVALGEMDVVGESAWEKLDRGAPPTPVSAPKAAVQPPTVVAHKVEPVKPATETAKKKVVSPPIAVPEAPTKSAQDVATVRERPVERLPIVEMKSVQPKPAATDLQNEQPPSFKREHDNGRQPNMDHQSSMRRVAVPNEGYASNTNPRVGSNHFVEPSSTTHSSGGSSITLPSHPMSLDSSAHSMHSAPELLRQERVPLPHRPTDLIPLRSPESPPQPRPPQGPRHVSSSVVPPHMGHAPRRSVSQIARDMERNAVNERQSAFEAHQGHASFATGCSLCAMDYDRMTQLRQTQARRVTMPPAYSHPDLRESSRDPSAGYNDTINRYRHEETETRSIHGYSDVEGLGISVGRGERQQRRPLSFHPVEPLHAPLPRRATGASPDFGESY